MMRIKLTKFAINVIQIGLGVLVIIGTQPDNILSSMM